MSKQFTVKEVGEHKDVKDGLYIIIDNGVYEMAGKLAHLALGHAHSLRLDRLCRGASWWLEDIEEGGRQGRVKAVLEISVS